MCRPEHGYRFMQVAEIIESWWIELLSTSLTLNDV